MSTQLDPITLEIVKNALSSIADEMALVILRTAYSPIVRDSMDYSTAVCDREGRTIAQGLTLPIHLGSFPSAMRTLIAQHGESMRAGDAFIMNDPYTSGGMHLPDVYIILPIHFEGKLEGFAATIVHHTDVGGLMPGSMALNATEIYQEGLRIPLVKLFSEGTPNQAIFDIFATNSRMPTQLLGDLRAQIAACHACERGILHLLQKYGSSSFNEYVNALHDYSEKLTRNAISQMPDGEYEAIDYIDGLGESGEPIVFKVKIIVSGEELAIDWNGTHPQVRGAINCPIATTISVAFAAVRAVASVDIPNCDGFARPITVRAEAGSLVNAVEPAACAARGVIAYRMFDTLMLAFAKVVPERVPAAGEGGPTVVSMSGRKAGKSWLITDGILGSWGGRQLKDGVDGISSPLANMSNQPIELIEARLPIRVTSYGLVKDSGGAGKHRGGLAIKREYESTEEGANFTVRSDRRLHLPQGLNGGFPGSPSLNILHDDADGELLPVMPMGLNPIKKGQVFTHIAAGGAGHGNPIERDPQDVLADILDDKISTSLARELYGVVLTKGGDAIDETSTRQSREKLAKVSFEQRAQTQIEIFGTTNAIKPAWLQQSAAKGVN
ncbi:hydantoinase B/oxoprolinase family protein [Glaciimonas sp. PCH181]|uniref:hydantoinase B/oxoprolinase family protein n=1 Tax=Glaciimonas sp. PCH181 TaxID=2133943 RepID=UPI000D3D6C49|nr:hydantoinase B/oxoprolinase family protein [Glaciimonas sp. PCH181]PUA18420.1 5-oxoprolinase [Glaciimonas sp. PCH181]